jgi:hypothetical protein
MIHEDLFVGSVAIVIGAFALVAAVLNWDWYYQLDKARWLESWCGRSGMRVFYGLLGIVLIMLGSAIAMGFSLNQESPGSQHSRPAGKFRSRPAELSPLTG